MLGKLDEKVIKYIKQLRSAGGIVNKTVVICTARGIVSASDKMLLQENGGHIDINRSWAESLMKRMGYVRRKGTKAARKIPRNFMEVKDEYRIYSCIGRICV